MYYQSMYNCVNVLLSICYGGMYLKTNLFIPHQSCGMIGFDIRLQFPYGSSVSPDPVHLVPMTIEQCVFKVLR